jgi:hypothetical protein
MEVPQCVVRFGDQIATRKKVLARELLSNWLQGRWPFPV